MKVDEASYAMGRRSANVMMLNDCLQRLGYDDSESARMIWVAEREAVVAQLRDLCGSFGDNDWLDSMNLADVIEKHLAKRLFTQFSF